MALPRLYGITSVMRLLVCNGIQPERLNAEGFSPSALSRGLSVSATPGMPSSSRKASERRENSRQGSRFSRSSNASWWASRYRGFRFAPPSATSHSLRSGVRPFRSCCGVVFLSRIFSDSVMVALPRIYAGDCARRKSRRCLLLCGLRIFANFAE